MRKTAALIFLAALLISLGGCAGLWAPQPDTHIYYETHGNIKTAGHVAVLLPGIGDRIDSFSHQGFLDIARPLLEEFPDSALITVDAHFGYYRERSIHIRLAEDILAAYPDKTFTFVGISLGGFGSLLMSAGHQDRIEKLVLFAPFLGDDDYKYLERLKQSGPVDREDDDELDLALNRHWRYLTGKSRTTPVYIAYGEDDKFVPYYDYLRVQKPQNIQFLEVRGGHDWDTWRTLWKTLAPIAIGRF